MHISDYYWKACCASKRKIIIVALFHARRVSFLKPVCHAIVMTLIFSSYSRAALEPCSCRISYTHHVFRHKAVCVSLYLRIPDKLAGLETGDVEDRSADWIDTASSEEESFSLRACLSCVQLRCKELFG